MSSLGYKFKSALRKVIIKTNPLWPFSFLNKMPYSLAIRCFVHKCRKLPQIKNVYLRNSLAEGGWTPGLSDIDLTIVIDSDQNIEKEFLFLVSFWKSYKRFKKLFLMLGEVEFLDTKLIKTWTRFGLRGYESRYWKLLFGTETISHNYLAGPESLEVDRLNYTLKHYRSFFLKEFFKKNEASLELRRLARKILRYLSYEENKNDWDDQEIFAGNKEDLLCRIIIGLEKRLARLPAGLLKLPERHGPVSHQLEPEYTDTLGPYQDAIESILLVPAALLKRSEKSTYLVVLKDGLTPAASRRCVSAVLKTFRDASKPVILSFSILNYMLRLEDPCRYYEIAKGTQVIYGRDLIAEIQPPGENDFLKSMMNRAMSVFINFRRRNIIAPLAVGKLASSLFIKEIISESLSVKLFLEKGEFIWDLDALLKRYEEFYPNYFKRIVKLTGEGMPRKHFLLLNDVANDVHKCILKMSS